MRWSFNFKPGPHSANVGKVLCMKLGTNPYLDEQSRCRKCRTIRALWVWLCCSTLLRCVWYRSEALTRGFLPFFVGDEFHRCDVSFMGTSMTRVRLYGLVNTKPRSLRYASGAQPDSLYSSFDLEANDRKALTILMPGQKSWGYVCFSGSGSICDFQS